MILECSRNLNEVSNFKNLKYLTISVHESIIQVEVKKSKMQKRKMTQCVEILNITQIQISCHLQVSHDHQGTPALSNNSIADYSGIKRKCGLHIMRPHLEGKKCTNFENWLSYLKFCSS